MTILVVLLLSCLLNVAQADVLCNLCDGGSYPLMDRFDLFVNEGGKTCLDLMLEMADTENGSTPGSTECLGLQTRFRRRCCDDSWNPVPIEQVDAQTQQNTGSSPYADGNFPSCNLCPNGDYPGSPGVSVAVMVDGKQVPNVSTCHELYWYAKVGRLDDRYCRPAANYYKPFCCTGGGGSSGSGGGSTGGGAPDTGDDGNDDTDGNDSMTTVINGIMSLFKWLVSLFR